MALKLENISIRFDNYVIVNNISFEFKSNLVYIFGRNGSGKTALLEALLGLIQFKGRITFNDIPVKSLKNISSKLLYIGHDISISEHLTVKDTLHMWAEISDSTILIPSAISYWSLEDILDLKICELSKGMIKRVELSKLIAMNCNLWVLDEPFVNLDAYYKERLNSLIKTRCENGGLVILTSHENKGMNGLELD